MLSDAGANPYYLKRSRRRAHSLFFQQRAHMHAWPAASCCFEATQTARTMSLVRRYACPRTRCSFVKRSASSAVRSSRSAMLAAMFACHGHRRRTGGRCGGSRFFVAFLLGGVPLERVCYSFVRRTVCTYVPCVPTYRVYLRTVCTYVPCVPTYRVYLRTVCTYTVCTYVPCVMRRRTKGVRASESPCASPLLA
jgi:hypothetical protein